MALLKSEIADRVRAYDLLVIEGDESRDELQEALTNLNKYALRRGLR